MFKVGDHVAFGLHGKCLITGIETKELDSGSVAFYQIRAIKNPLIPKAINKNDAAILVPVEGAQNRGLRTLLTKEQVEPLLKLLEKADPDLEITVDKWVSKQKSLEEIIRKNGAEGLTRVLGKLHVVLQNTSVPPTEVTRFYETITRIFCREVSEALGQPTKDVENLLARAFRARLENE